MADSNYYVWIEIEANKQRLLDEDYFGAVLDQCQEAGIGSVILAVKDTSGFGIYKSRFVPHYSLYDRDFGETDYLGLYVDMAHEKRIKLFAGVDVFAEGKVNRRSNLSPGFRNPEWQTSMYAVDASGNPVIKPISQLGDARTAGSIDDFHEVFVNPVREDVRRYELEIIREIIQNYDVDGIVLDRVRFIGLGSDFSRYTREKFEEYTGKRVENWPFDIFKLSAQEGGEGLQVEYGPLFGRWLTFRAGIIKDFVLEVRRMVEASGKNILFCDYTGSWYPNYYYVGANCASGSDLPEEYPWVGGEYSATGYAEDLDILFSGFYYPEVTAAEAEKAGRPAYWYSVEGSGDMVKKVTLDKVPVVGSLFLQQYEGKPEVFGKAVEMCFQKSGSCMLFDLCYIDGYNWWAQCKRDKLPGGSSEKE